MVQSRFGSIRENAEPFNSRWLWMFFSWFWIITLISPALQFVGLPTDSASDDYVADMWKWGALALVAAFIGIYTFAMYTVYFRRISWAEAFNDRDAVWIRWSITVLAIALCLLPGPTDVNWHLSFLFVAIIWALTTHPENASASVFQAAGISALVLALTGRADMIPGTLLVVIAFGLMVASFAKNNGLIGELIVEQSRVRDQAVTEERFRLARDLHDTVGHSMTQITLKAELARRLLPDDPSRSADELEQIEELSRSLSAEVRRSIAGETNLSLPAEIERAEELLQSMEIDVAINVNHADIAHDAADAFAWCLREGVMNVIKHSGASRCEIEFSQRDQHHILNITDNGRNPVTDDHKGQGMAGMKQRVDELNGDIEFRPTDSGHLLTVRIPV